MANLVPSWRPTRLQNRGRNLKKSMLKTNAFLASFFFKGSDLVLEGFLVGFGVRKCMKKTKRKISENLENIDFPQGKLIFSRF